MAEQSKVIHEQLPKLEDIRQRVQKIEAELGGEAAPEKKIEIVKREIKGYLQELQGVPSFATPVQLRDEADEISKLEPDQKIGALVSLVFEKGLKEAINVAQALDNPAILDEFHDILIDRYYKAMVDQGIIKID